MGSFFQTLRRKGLTLPAFIDVGEEITRIF